MHDSFLLQVLDKFGLLHWADTDFQVAEEESIRHLTSLVEEFFGFLVTVIGERYTPGVGDITNEDMVRKEIIQLLCVEPMSHSALKKALPEDVFGQDTYCNSDTEQAGVLHWCVNDRPF